MQVLRSGLPIRSIAALLTVLFIACAPGDDGPASPASPGPLLVPGNGNDFVPQVTTFTVWDFAALFPGAADPEDLGTTETISTGDPADGTIAASTGAATQHITVKGKSLPVGDTERGMGLCLTAGVTCTFPADGDEVGDGGPGILLLNFSGVLPAGSVLEAVDLGSLQVDEGYKISISTDGGVTFGTPIEAYDGDADDNKTLLIGLPTANLVLKFEKAADIADNDNDYTVKSVTISFTTEETIDGRMTGGGVKATGDDDETVTLGLTLHCDILLSNNLEINWEENKWHLTKPITEATCSKLDLDPTPPASPIDTFEGVAFGELNGVGNSRIEFRFQDAGEPGSDDTIELTIFEPGSSTVALHISFQKLSVGNFQMHFDQPHGQKP